MRDLIEIVVPCKIFGVQVRLATAGDQTTPLERFVLRAIGTGIDQFSELSQIFPIGQRPLLDLIHDLWLGGNVVVDLDSGQLQLTGNAATAYEEGRLAELKTCERNYQTITLMQELVSGAVLPEGGRLQPFGPQSLLVPTELTDLSLELIGSTALMAAIRQNRRQDRQSSRSQSRGFIDSLEVIEAWLEPERLILMPSSGASLGQEHRYLGVEVDVSLDGETDRLDFEVVGPPSLPALIRRDIGQRLSAMAGRQPDQLFFRRLRELRSAHDQSVQVSPWDSIERLLRHTDALAETNPGVLEARQSELIGLLDEAEAALHQAVRAQARTQVIHGHRDQDALIRTLLEEAQHQLVFANPWIDFNALIKPLEGGDLCWLDLIEAALARGVQCVLLWGIRDDAFLAPNVLQAWLKLAGEYPTAMRFSTRSAVVHAKFVVCDAGRALVTSYNFLDPSASADTMELGVVVEGLEPGVANEVALQLLQWTRRRFPEYDVGRSVLCTADSFAAREPLALDLPRPPEIPVSTVPAIRHWAQQWRAHAEHLRVLLRNQRASAELVEDRQHRDILWEALRHGKRRLVVLSDRLSVDVVTDRFVAQVESRLKDGAFCHFAYRREGASDLELGPASRLTSLASQWPRCSVVETNNHAKVLLVDDEVTIGSFNFLSYVGEYRTGRRERSELSVRIRDQQTAASVIELLGPVLPEAFAAQSVETLPSLLTRAPLPRGLAGFFRAVDESDDHLGALRNLFAQSGDPWADLASLQLAGVDDALLSKAVGAALSVARDVEDHAARFWRGWLADDRWRQRDFIGAALLLPTEGSSPQGLSHDLAALAAAVQCGQPFDGQPAVLRGQEAAIYCAMVGVLVHGEQAYFNFLQQIADAAPLLMRPWVAAVEMYWHPSRPGLPLPLLRRMATQQGREKAALDGLKMIEQALIRFESLHFNFTLGQRTWGWLQRSDELFGRMRAFHESRDARGCRDYLVSLPSPGDVLDQASLAAQAVWREPIRPPKRDVCLKRIEVLVKAARYWSDAAADADLDPEDARRLDACHALRAALSTLPNAATDSLSGPPHRFLLAEIEPLFAMGEA